jgi:hypothetical protein
MKLEVVLPVLPKLVLCLTSVTASIGVSFSVLAEAGGPDFWQVRDVDRGDVLNMRSEADFKSSKTGEIPFDAQCVRNMGCKGGLTFDEYTQSSEIEKQQILKQRPRWCRVSYKGATGWVAGRYLKEGTCRETDDSRRDRPIEGVDAFNHSYSIEKEKVMLRNGSAREKIPGTAAVIITEIIQKPLYADLDGDTAKEAVVVLMQHTGGTGSFYYLAIASEGGEVSESYFLGDRIKIVSLKIIDGMIIAAFFEHSADQPMSSVPAKKTTKRFKLVSGKLLIDSP